MVSVSSVRVLGGFGCLIEDEIAVIDAWCFEVSGL